MDALVFALIVFAMVVVVMFISGGVLLIVATSLTIALFEWLWKQSKPKVTDLKLKYLLLKSEIDDEPK